MKYLYILFIGILVLNSQEDHCDNCGAKIKNYQAKSEVYYKIKSLMSKIDHHEADEEARNNRLHEGTMKGVDLSMVIGGRYSDLPDALKRKFKSKSEMIA
jgi:hypothetical protein